ncbi:MAG: nicotinate-nucleotide adenylyltransferase [Lachnospiraceae bacterium]|nr:nicotinate-nucleotide adenylyltransferase [Lachnospiraceae bacterium]
MMEMKKIRLSDYEKFNCIALMGGTFNPVHNGHLELAKAAKEQYSDIEKVIFLPNNKPAYKSDKELISPDERIDMLALAIEDMAYACISDIEIKRGDITYSADTIAEIRGVNSDLKIYFIVGADSLYTVNKWYKYEEFLKSCSLLVARRNSEYEDMRKYADKIMKKIKGADIDFIIIPEIDISSTDIRDNADDYDYLSDKVPEKVRAYIQENSLYV